MNSARFQQNFKKKIIFLNFVEISTKECLILEQSLNILNTNSAQFTQNFLSFISCLSFEIERNFGDFLKKISQKYLGM